MQVPIPIKPNAPPWHQQVVGELNAITEASGNILRTEQEKVGLINLLGRAAMVIGAMSEIDPDSVIPNIALFSRDGKTDTLQACGISLAENARGAYATGLVAVTKMPVDIRAAKATSAIFEDAEGTAKGNKPKRVTESVLSSHAPFSSGTLLMYAAPAPGKYVYGRGHVNYIGQRVSPVTKLMPVRLDARELRIPSQGGAIEPILALRGVAQWEGWR